MANEKLEERKTEPVAMAWVNEWDRGSLVDGKFHVLRYLGHERIKNHVPMVCRGRRVPKSNRFS